MTNQTHRCNLVHEISAHRPIWHNFHWVGTVRSVCHAVHWIWISFDTNNEQMLNGLYGCNHSNCTFRFDANFRPTTVQLNWAEIFYCFVTWLQVSWLHKLSNRYSPYWMRELKSTILRTVDEMTVLHRTDDSRYSPPIEPIPMRPLTREKVKWIEMVQLLSASTKFQAQIQWKQFQFSVSSSALFISISIVLLYTSNRLYRSISEWIVIYSSIW